MSHRPACQTADFFVLRAPGLPVGAVFPQVEDTAMEPPAALDDRLRSLVRRDVVREALALASPDLAARLDPWLAGALDAPAARGVTRALLKYLSRMGSRSTPFGLFAGVSLGGWGAASHLALGPWQASRKALRLDWGVLEALVDRLAQEPEVRAELTYRPNTSLYLRGGWYRYLERREGAPGQGRTYHLEAVEATPHLEAVLQRAQDGCRLTDLAQDLASRAGVTQGDALAYLQQLVDAQVLCDDLQPPLSCAEPLAHVVAALQAHPGTAPRAAALGELAAELQAFQQAPAGAHAGGLPGLAACLANLGLPPDTRDLLQVDLHRPAPGLTLSPAVRQALVEGAELLRRLTPPPVEGPLDRFRAAFLARHGSRWVPLLEVLDEESGLGFDGGAPTESPLLLGLPLAGPAPARPFTPRDQVLLGRLIRLQGARSWELSEADVAALAPPDPPPFPASFAALASLEAASPAALDQGDFRFWLEHHSGPTAARWVGRFASGDAALQEALARHLQREVAGQPEAVFAEVVHVPEPPCCDADQLLRRRLQPLRVMRHRLGLERAHRHVEPGNLAAAHVQRRHRLGAAAVAQFGDDAGAAECVVQGLDRKAVAGVDAQHRRRADQHAVDLGLQLGRQRIQCRRQPRGDAPVGPDQLLGQRAQRRAAAALHVQQRRAQQGLALADQLPGMAVRDLHRLAGLQQAAVFSDADQQRHGAFGKRRATGAANRPLRLDADLVHGRPIMLWPAYMGGRLAHIAHGCTTSYSRCMRKSAYVVKHLCGDRP